MPLSWPIVEAGYKVKVLGRYRDVKAIKQGNDRMLESAVVQ